MAVRLLRVEFGGTVVIGNGVVVISYGDLGITSLETGVPQVRVERDGEAEVLNGAVAIFHGALGKTPEIAGMYVSGVEFDGEVEVGNGLVVLTLDVFGEASLVVGVRVFRLSSMARLNSTMAPSQCPSPALAMSRFKQSSDAGWNCPPIPGFHRWVALSRSAHFGAP